MLIRQGQGCRREEPAMANDARPDRYDIDTSDVMFPPATHFDVAAIAAATQPWWNRTLTQVNDAVVRLGVMEGDFHWHKHDDEDEFFYVLEGALTIEVEGRASFELAPGQGVTIPRGLAHCPHAHGRTVVLMVEKGTVIPTGDWGVESGTLGNYLTPASRSLTSYRYVARR